MKKLIFALPVALGAALIPMSAHAASYTISSIDDCANGSIVIANGESSTITLSGNVANCKIINNGTLTINGNGTITSNIKGDTIITNNGKLTLNGGTFNKTAIADSASPIVNNGTFVMNGGVIKGDHGINHSAGSVTINGGKIYSPLFPSIWAANSSPIRINGGYFKFPIDWVGVYTHGNATICGGTFDGGARSNLSDTVVSASCPAEKAPAPAAPAAPAAATVSPAVVTESNNSTKATSAQKATIATTAPAVEQKVEEKPTETDEFKINLPAEAKELPVAGNEEEKQNDRTLGIIIAATVAVLASASAGILITRIRH